MTNATGSPGSGGRAYLDAVSTEPLHPAARETLLAALDRARHGDPVEAHEQELGQPLTQLQVAHALEEVRIVAPCAPLGTTATPAQAHRVASLSSEPVVIALDGAPAEKDGKGSIGKVGLDGKIIQAEWVTGLNAPKGMAITGNSLWVADVDRLDVVTGLGDALDDLLDLFGDGIPGLDDQIRVPVGGPTTVSTPELDDIVIELVPQDQYACTCHANYAASQLVPCSCA